jgi:hypothetical protein
MAHAMEARSETLRRSIPIGAAAGPRGARNGRHGIFALIQAR